MHAYVHIARSLLRQLWLWFLIRVSNRERERERERERGKKRGNFPSLEFMSPLKLFFSKKSEQVSERASERASKRANEVASHLVATAAFIIRALLRRKFTLCAYYHATTAVTTVCYAEYGSVISHENIPSCDVFLVCHRL